VNRGSPFGRPVEHVISTLDLREESLLVKAGLFPALDT